MPKVYRDLRKYLSYNNIRKLKSNYYKNYKYLRVWTILTFFYSTYFYLTYFYSTYFHLTQYYLTYFY